MRSWIGALVGALCAGFVFVCEYAFDLDLTFAQRMIILLPMCIMAGIIVCKW